MKTLIAQDNLSERGRVQYFYHCPSSNLPIRDVLNEQGYGFKTEPHIEAGAENLWKECYQNNNIIPFIRSDEKYLFLMTNCKSDEFPRVQNKKSIVGFLEKKGYGLHYVNDKEIFYVFGNTKLVGFENAVLLEDLGLNTKIRGVKLINEELTKRILEKFTPLENILELCIQEIKMIDNDNITCFKEKNYPCPFVNYCNRYGK